MFRKEIFNKVGVRYYADKGPAADIYFALEANAKGMEIFLIREALLEYRQHGISNSSRSDSDVWARSCKHQEELIKGFCLGIDLTTIRAKFATSLLSKKISELAADVELGRFTEIRKNISNQYGWELSDARFRKVVVNAYLKNFIIDIGNKKGTFQQYREKRKKVRSLGIPVPVFKEMEWFVKYVVMARK
jgi:hypothetical protein